MAAVNRRTGARGLSSLEVAVLIAAVVAIVLGLVLDERGHPAGLGLAGLAMLAAVAVILRRGLQRRS